MASPSRSGPRQVAYGHRLHQRPAAADPGHYLHSKVRSDVWGVLQQLRQQQMR